MPSLVDELNIAIKPYCEAVKNGTYSPFEYQGLNEGITGFYSTAVGAVALNPPIAGMCRELTREPGIVSLQTMGDRFILRTVLDYAMAADYINNPQVFTMRAINLINGMTGAAYKVYGPRVLKLSFDIPGINDRGNYFRELENSAGYEIRLYGELSPAIILERETI